MRRITNKPRKAPLKFFEEFDYQSLLLKDSDVDDIIKLYSTYIEANHLSILNRIEYKKLLETHSKVLTLASYCTDKKKAYYVEWAISNIQPNSKYSDIQIEHYYSFFNYIKNTEELCDENANLSDDTFNLYRDAIRSRITDDRYLDLFILKALDHGSFDILSYEFFDCMFDFEITILHSIQFNSIYEILKFLNLDADLKMPVIEYVKLISSMTGEEFYDLVLQQLSRRYNKEWFYSQMPNTFKTAEEARVAFEIMMNCKYDGNVSK